MNMTTYKASMAGLLLAALTAGPAAAEKAKPYEKPEDTWISISGTVDAVSSDTFTLDYGQGNITVEMDDGDRDADAYKLIKGDKVRVSGMIDDDLFETRTLEAASVYVENLDTYFYASAMDEEDAVITVTTPITITTPVVISETVIRGVVTETSDEEFVIDTGLREVRVEVEEMAYNPLDDEGYQKIEVGDRVSVTGDMDDDFLEGRELVADSVITLSD
ncbi:MAG: hypothetical protein U5S82_15310 [Gammaproteobacteria bacterium]|nr:hypothetical protein [Gammaproteobacteria bacterium]